MTSLKCTGLAARMLKLDEGLRATPYKDSLGYWTIGVGHYIGVDLSKISLSEAVIETMLCEDIETAWKGVVAIFGEQVETWTDARQLAALNLVFNLGESRLRKFVRTISAMKDGRWDDAATQLGASLWAKQVKSRATRVIHMVRTGELHDSYRA